LSIILRTAGQYTNLDNAMCGWYVLFMHKGFNSDITVRGQKYHIQTEDWGNQNPFVVSRVFCNGAVLKTIKTPYESIMSTGPVSVHESIKLALQKQHNHIIDVLMSGGQP
jgi:hypothetical protein